MAAQGKKKSTTGKSTGRKSTAGKSTASRKPNTASKNRSRTGKSSSSVRSSSSARNSSATKKYDDGNSIISSDVKIITGFAIVILLELSNFSLIGRFGNAISGFMFGIFGLFAYIVPILVFIAIGFFIANVSSRKAMMKLGAAIVLFITLCTFLQLVYAGKDYGFRLTSVFNACRIDKNGGGMLGGLFAAILYSTIGIYGAFIVVIALVLISMVIISEKSLINSVKHGSRQMYDSARKDFKRMKDSSAERIAKKEQNKMERAKNTVRGVNLHSKVTDENAVDANVHELLQNGSLYRGYIDSEELEKASAKNNNNSTDNGYNESGKKKQYRTDYKPAFIKDNIDNSENSDSSYEENFAETSIMRGDIADNNIFSNSDSYNSSSNVGSYNSSSNISSYNNASNVSSYDNTSNISSYDNNEELSEAVRNGEFKPKEKIEVSKAAKEVMKRKAFSGVPIKSSSSVKDIPIDRPVPDVEKVTEQPKAVEEVSKGNKSGPYSLPPLSLLRKGTMQKRRNSMRPGEISETAAKLQETLNAFGVKATVINESRGPSVTRYELQPETGTKVSKITSLSDDIKLNLAAADIRIEAPIPGKAAVGIEVPNAERDSVFLRDLIESVELSKHPSKLAFAAGMDIAGKVVVADIAKMPHMLIAGTTGSGKSVFTNSIIMSILFRAKPSEVKMIIVDPKVVEFGVYNGIPHLLSPVVTDPKKAAGVLNWAVGEMGKRYKQFSKYNVRDIKGYNEKIKQMGYKDGDEQLESMYQIVIIIDELADLMMVASKEVESSICRLAQLARAAGIHLIIATQRPSVDVVTGLIKANIPSRVALLVSSGTDSRTIIDCNGGEKLLGNGDMLFYPSGYVKPVRLQGAFVSDGEVQAVVNYLINNNKDVEYNEEVTKAEVSTPDSDNQTEDDDGNDVLFEEAARFVIEKDKGSTSMIQRMFKVGFNRASRIIEQLEKAGVVGSDEGTKPRKVLMSLEQFEASLHKETD
ncbi:MAG: DNA translocase FtsK [Eubacteriales bacterium]|nr:DNA translocase FtsK [Eubacteriales bacterium]